MQCPALPVLIQQHKRVFPDWGNTVSRFLGVVRRVHLRVCLRVLTHTR